MLMTDEEVEARLESPNNLVKIIEKARGGRTAGATNIPPSVRALIAVTANGSRDSQKEIAEEFGIDQSSVSEIKKGIVGGKLDKELRNVGQEAARDLKTAEDSAHEAAMSVLMTSLGQLQPRLLDPELKPKELSKIAADMAKVAGAMKPRDENAGVTNNTQVILISTPRKQVGQYEIVEGK